VNAVKRSEAIKRAALLLPLLTGVALSCKREQRTFRVEPPSADATESVAVSALFPGAQPTTGPVSNDYEKNAYALAEGKRLFSQYNCSGCHANGGGGMGPPLMDDEWLYGYEPQQVYATIVQGRPNGMPSFMGKIPDYQVWELAAYVRSMSGQVPSAAAPGRNDDMQGPPPENSVDTPPPKNTRVPS
jgi:cytochrome c oxidase cbb3-type subunit 3